MSKTLKKLAILVVVTLAVVGSILGGLSAKANAQSSDEAAIKAEVKAAARQLGKALNTSDGELFDTLWFHSDKVTDVSITQPSGSKDGQTYDSLLLDSLGCMPETFPTFLDKSASTCLAMTWRSIPLTLSLGSGRLGQRR